MEDPSILFNDITERNAINISSKVDIIELKNNIILRKSEHIVAYEIRNGNTIWIKDNKEEIKIVNY